LPALQNEFARARVVAIELKAGLVRHQGFEQRLALEERQTGDVAAVDVDEIESVKDEPSGALAVGRCLDAREARQSGIIDAAELAIEIGGLHVQVRKRCDGARIFVSPVEPSAGQQLRLALVDPRGHAIAVELDLMQPLRPRRRFLN